MMLAAGPGQKVTITADGNDEVEAVDAIASLIDSGFGEEMA
jgi:phosphocarrier protein